MRKNKKYFKPMTRDQKNDKLNKLKAMERESNITLASVATVIVSFFVLLYISSTFKVNWAAGKQMIDVVTILLLVGAVACAVAAIWKKKAFLWEYVVFALVLAIAYYLLPRGVAGIPGLVKETPNTFEVSKLGNALSDIITNRNITYALWLINILYGIYAIVFHSIRYSKIKKGNI